MSSSSINEGDEGGEGDVAARALEVGDDGSADRVRAEEKVRNCVGGVEHGASALDKSAPWSSALCRSFR